MRSDYLLEYILIGVLVVVVVVVAVAVLSSANVAPRAAAFNADLLAVVDNCAQNNVRASTVMIGSSPITTKHVDADGLLRCLYSSGVTVVQNGDPVVMK